MMSVRLGQTGYGLFDERRRIGPACWEHFDLLWVHSGAVTIRFMEQDPQRFGAGQGVLIHPDTPFVGHATTPQARASIQHFTIEPRHGEARLPEPYERLRGLWRGYDRFTTDHPERFDAWIDRAMELSHAAQSSLIHDTRVALLAWLLGELTLERMSSPRPGPERDRFDGLLEAMRSKPEEVWSLPMMAERAGLSVSHFRALFRQRMGVSPGQYQQELRMGEAARLLRETDMPIKRIATVMGFSDLPHFHRRFKRVYGQTPRRYRDSRSPRA